MRGDRVLVRAYDDEPFERAVWEVRDRGVMIYRPDLALAVEAGESGPVGFPNEAVFAFNTDLFRELKVAHAKGSRQDLVALWERAKPYTTTGGGVPAGLSKE